jgi:lipoyl(octanoyl) transferase
MAARVAAIQRGEAPECVWLLEHPPVYTAGVSAKPADLLASRFPVYATGRGGQWTYHGPGQRIVYLMLDLRRPHGSVPARDVHAFVAALETWIIHALARFGVKGERRAGRVGVWVEVPGRGECKIAAAGVRLSRFVSSHGIAINRAPDLSHFEGIVPCGLATYGVTSLAELGRPVSADELDAALFESFGALFGDLPPFIHETAPP